jgi:hypothetical protein
MTGSANESSVNVRANLAISIYYLHLFSYLLNYMKQLQALGWLRSLFQHFHHQDLTFYGRNFVYTK